MLVAAAPIAIPVTTANPPTESVAAEAAHKPQIPAPKPSAESGANRPTQENAPDTKNNLQNQNRIQGEAEQQSDSENGSDAEKEDSSRRQQQEQQAQQVEVQQLRSRDRAVRAHETAHASVGGQLAGAPQLDFTTGPDGKRYAVSGEVQIDTGKVANDPLATIQKMEQVQRAALAPADPSGQDLRVAATAAQVANQARVELRAQQTEQTVGGANTDGEQGASEDNSTQQTNSQNSSSIRFTSPVVARRASLQLQQKLHASGAFEDVNREQLFEARV